LFWKIDNRSINRLNPAQKSEYLDPLRQLLINIAWLLIWFQQQFHSNHVKSTINRNAKESISEIDQIYWIKITYGRYHMFKLCERGRLLAGNHKTTRPTCCLVKIIIDRLLQSIDKYKTVKAFVHSVVVVSSRTILQRSDRSTTKNA